MFACVESAASSKVEIGESILNRGDGWNLSKIGEGCRPLREKQCQAAILRQAGLVSTGQSIGKGGGRSMLESQ